MIRNNALITATRKELEHIRTDELCLSTIQDDIFQLKFMQKLDRDSICTRLNISHSTYHRHLRIIYVMMERLYTNG